MLSFVEKYDSTPPKISKRCFPQLKNGVSYEAPTEFHTQHALYCESTYNNPHLAPVSDEPAQALKAPIANPIYIQTRSLRDMENPESKDIDFKDNYKQQLSGCPGQFHKVKGLFVDFIDRNLWQMQHNLVSKGRLKTEDSEAKRSNSRTIEVLSDNKSRLVSQRQSSLKTIKNMASRQSLSRRPDTIKHSDSSLSRASPLLEKARIRSQRHKFSQQTSLLLDKRKLKPGMQVTKTSFPLINKLKMERKVPSSRNLEQTIIRERIRIIRAPWYHSNLGMSNSQIEQSLR